MTTRARPYVAALAVSLLCAACDNSPELADLSLYTVNLTLLGFTSAPRVVSLEARGAPLSITSSVLALDSLALVPCTSGAASITLPARSYQLSAEFPPRESIDTATVDYCELVLTPVSFVAKGERADGAPYEVALAFPGNERITLAGDGTAFGDEPLFLALDLATLLAGPELEDSALEDAELDEDGALIIDAEHHPELAETLAARLPAALAAYVDESEDGAFDDDERSAVAQAR